MAVKGSYTTSDYIPWDEMNSLLRELERDKQFMVLILIAVGSYTGLRISDILRLTWKSFNGTHIELFEYKTKKYRRIKIHKILRGVMERVKSNIQAECEHPILLNPNRNAVYCISTLTRSSSKSKRTIPCRFPISQRIRFVKLLEGEFGVKQVIQRNH